MGQPKDSEFKDRDTMTLDLDDGGKLECIVLNVFPVNNREYIALLPMNDEGHVKRMHRSSCIGSKNWEMMR